MTGPVVSQPEDSQASSQKHDFIPVLEEGSPATNAESGAFHKKLRAYFLHEKKTTDTPQINAVPVLLAPVLRGRNPEMDFPALYDYESQEVTSLSQVLQEIFSDIFNPGEADTLGQSLPRIVSFIQERFDVQDPDPGYVIHIKEAFKDLRQLEVPEEEDQLFRKQCDQLEAHLLTRKGTLIGFSALTAFQVLNLQLKEQNIHQGAFLTALNKCISGLNEILLLQNDDTDPSQSHSDFAGELLSFDKITDMSLPKASSDLPEARLNRLRSCLETLVKAQQSYAGNMSTIFVTQKLADEFALKQTLNQATLEITSEDACAKAKDLYKKEIIEFVRIIAALRLANLEISQKYDDKLHTPYFDGFDLSYLSDEDFRNFRSMIVVDESRQLALQPADFLALLSEGAHIKVLAVNRLEEMNVTAGQTEEDSYMELAALAIFRRNAYVFQGAAYAASRMNKAFCKGLDSPYPVLWNILFTKPQPIWDKMDFLKLKTAIESRYFPQLEYDILSGEGFGRHFDLSGNPQPERAFPSFYKEIKTPSGKQNHEYNLTIADYLAIIPANQTIPEILPSGYSNKDLIPLHTYLEVPQDSLAGKIPFIWLADDQNILKQAVIPISWLRRCRARLDYWRFLQELGGVKNDFMENAVEEARSEWDAAKEKEINEIKTQLRVEFDRTRTDDISKAINRMLNRLLDSEYEITTLLHEASTHSVSSRENGKEAPEPKPAPKEEVTKPAISSEAWVESDDCTSCSDCVDALPSVFKYNSDKLAFVHNPKGGTYAKIVATAEKCPARCIHPGLPQNSGEPGLEKLLKRAEKYN